ncbi:MAG: restriction endonuclease [Acidobacteria bacterium]|nr:restriction endonuclease [Acidobacteriota bacterium]MBV9071072.1 restriction endonuclease [Acidobacteriota bacterium]
MAQVTRKRVGELARGVFTVLMTHSDGLAAKAVLEQMWAVVPPTDFERQNYPANPEVRRYEKMVRFATISSVKAGWLSKNKGLWSLTEEGRGAYSRFADPYEFIREAGRLYKQWKDQQPEEEPEAEDEEFATEAVDAAMTLEEAEESAWSEIETYLAEMNPYDFQQLVAGLLRGMGYHVSWVSPPGPDRGIDVIAHSDPLGITGPRIKVQVKRTAERIPSRDVRSFFAVIADVDVGLFVATGGFTKDAEDETRTQERRRVMLLDLRRFFDLWVEHYARIPEQSRRLLPLKPVQFLALTQ